MKPSREVQTDSLDCQFVCVSLYHPTNYFYGPFNISTLLSRAIVSSSHASFIWSSCIVALPRILLLTYQTMAFTEFMCILYWHFLFCTTIPAWWCFYSPQLVQYLELAWPIRSLHCNLQYFLSNLLIYRVSFFVKQHQLQNNRVKKQVNGVRWKCVQQ